MRDVPDRPRDFGECLDFVGVSYNLGDRNDHGHEWTYGQHRGQETRVTDFSDTAPPQSKPPHRTPSQQGLAEQDFEASPGHEHRADPSIAGNEPGFSLRAGQRHEAAVATEPKVPGPPRSPDEWERFVEARVFGGRPIRYPRSTVERAVALLVPRAN